MKHLFHLHLAALAVGVIFPRLAAGADKPNHWHIDTSLNLFAAGMSGDVTVKGQAAHVDPSFSDIFDQFEGGAAGRVTFGYDQWFLSTEFSYMKLGADTAAANVELKQWLVEPTLGYQFCENFAVFAGARYNSIEADIDPNGPLGFSGGETKDWPRRCRATPSAAPSASLTCGSQFCTLRPPEVQQ